jgi:hypothetical protein
MNRRRPLNSRAKMSLSTRAEGTAAVGNGAGSPVSTRTIRYDALPSLNTPLRRSIELNATQSRPCWPRRVGVGPTPALDRIAQNGVCHTNFHSTPVPFARSNP